MKTGQTLGQVVRGASRKDKARRLLGEVIGVGNGTADVLLDGGSGVLTRKRTTGMALRVGQRVELQQVAGDYVVVAVMGG